MEQGVRGDGAPFLLVLFFVYVVWGVVFFLSN